MGTVLGAFLTKNGVPVDLITRNISHVQALKERGAHVVGTVDFSVPVSALLPEEMSGEYDLVFLMTKQRYNAETVAFLLPHLSQNGVICTMQNGLPEPSVAAICGKERCLGCAVSWGATFVGEGSAELTSSTDSLTFAVGSVYGENPHSSAVQRVLSHMGRATVESNFIGARFAKLAVNSAFSSLSAVTGRTFGEVANDKKSRKIAQALLNEAFTVARSYGIKVGKIQGHDIARLLGYKTAVKRAISFALIPLAMKNHARLKSGMLFDLQKGKNCEMEFINGVVAKMGKNTGTPTPLNDAVLDITRRIVAGELQISECNLSLFKA